jgi:hypothetical protein
MASNQLFLVFDRIILSPIKSADYAPYIAISLPIFNLIQKFKKYHHSPFKLTVPLDCRITAFSAEN